MHLTPDNAEACKNITRKHINTHFKIFTNSIRSPESNTRVECERCNKEQYRFQMKERKKKIRKNKGTKIVLVCEECDKLIEEEKAQKKKGS